MTKTPETAAFKTRTMFVAAEGDMLSVLNLNEILRPASARQLSFLTKAVTAGLPVDNLIERGPVIGLVLSLVTVPEVELQNEKSWVASVPDSMKIVAP